MTSVIGPNGAGKSTFLSMASRLVSRGSVFIDLKLSIFSCFTSVEFSEYAVYRERNSFVRTLSKLRLLAVFTESLLILLKLMVTNVYIPITLK
uniref:ATP-binding cassette domain-containing protein n=2 Tax=Vibrio TaxID=662 RepID=A0A0H3ZNP7_9VIBR|nr:hypothetical protein [Vibrio kanaloae]AKN38302.1 hypothetical protein [Vibrio sp. 1S_269]AKN37378.1 hypothetical protein [Vibrio kanaloae]AKN37810.1 hypothetical protein [Vibrio kanaloae]AKN38872.1 hypothetical protein [Vibrio kanaloae]